MVADRIANVSQQKAYNVSSVHSIKATSHARAFRIRHNENYTNMENMFPNKMLSADIHRSMINVCVSGVWVCVFVCVNIGVTCDAN